MNKNSKNGSAVIAVIISLLILTTITASVLSLATAERRISRQSTLYQAARNGAESAQEYVLAQIKNKLKMRNDFSTTDFSTGADAVTAPPASFYTTSGLNDHSVEVVAGLATDPAGNALVFLDPLSTQYSGSILAGLNAFLREVPVISKCSATVQGVTATSYMGQTVRAYIVPLFSFAVFYNMDMEFFPGPDMDINGPVHANGNMFLRKQSSSSRSLDFLSRVSCTGGIYSTKANKYYLRSGSIDATNYTDNVRFANSSTSTLTGLYGSYWRDHLYGGSSETVTSKANFKTFVDSTYGVNVRTSVHGVGTLVPPGFGDNPDTPAVDPLDGRTLIEAPNASDSAVIKAQKLSRVSGLYIVVNPDPNMYTDSTYTTKGTAVDYRHGLLPNGTSVRVKNGHYRVFDNQGNELILPGQRYYGYPVIDLNPAANPDSSTNCNAFTGMGTPGSGDTTNPLNPSLGDTAFFSTGTNWTSYANAVVRMYCGSQASPSASGGHVFYDLRRVRYALDSRSSSKPHTPREIVKIDIDMQNLKKAIARTVNGGTTASVYLTTPLSSSNYTAVWSNSIYNSSAAPISKTLNSFNNIYSVTSHAPAGSTFWNGAIYVLSLNAESKTLDTTATYETPLRTDSGVRLVHGRGALANSATGTQGLTIATNDAVYIVGNYNADGTISTGTSTTSSRYPDNASEKAAAVMGDSITILSQPLFSANSGNPKQISGWNDALSGLRIDNYSSYSSSWATSAPSSSNAVDGNSTTTSPYQGPLDPDSGAGVAGTRNYKFAASHTEVATAFLTGLVPSIPVSYDSSSKGLDPATANGYQGNKTPLTYSGGVHNFPRFLEDWFGSGSSAVATCAIRGSMVAMFSSQVATEPWTLRVYQAPDRLWGLHDLFINGTMPPFTPNVIDLEQLNFRTLTKPEYETKKSEILSL